MSVHSTQWVYSSVKSTGLVIKASWSYLFGRLLYVFVLFVVKNVPRGTGTQMRTSPARDSDQAHSEISFLCSQFN